MDRASFGNTPARYTGLELWELGEVGDAEAPPAPQPPPPPLLQPTPPPPPPGSSAGGPHTDFLLARFNDEVLLIEGFLSLYIFDLRLPPPLARAESSFELFRLLARSFRESIRLPTCLRFDPSLMVVLCSSVTVS